MSRSTIELALLGFIRSRPMYGYEIHQQLADPQGLDGLWRLKLSRLYGMLGRLEAGKLIIARSELQGDRPPRKVYSLTAEGEEAYLAWLKEPVIQPRELRLEFMLKLYFARREGPQWVTHLLAAQQRQSAEWLAGPLVASGPTDNTLHQEAVRRFRQGQIEAMNTWLNWLVAENTRLC